MRSEIEADVGGHWCMIGHDRAAELLRALLLSLKLPTVSMITKLQVIDRLRQLSPGRLGHHEWGSSEMSVGESSGFTSTSPSSLGSPDSSAVVSSSEYSSCNNREVLDMSFRLYSPSADIWNRELFLLWFRVLYKCLSSSDATVVTLGCRVISEVLQFYLADLNNKSNMERFGFCLEGAVESQINDPLVEGFNHSNIGARGASVQAFLLILISLVSSLPFVL